MINEILVDVGRDGELLLVDGRHRLSIAKILGLDEIPVVKHVRHEQWVARSRRGERTTEQATRAAAYYW